ncbi:hypothetical protein [Streptomyces sp. SM12]|uniref:hypothetical protein n=1 Tax=Streptomyces sp. SM12 TaxID=1071602 RepID=UPI000CD56E3E|nr:hypothetical protein [Streptomyces sp. SM12]
MTKTPTGTGLNQPKEPKEPRFAALREWWSDAWDEYGVLRTRWDEVRTAPDDGWHGMATWIKVTLATLGFSIVLLFLAGAVDATLATLHRVINAAPDLTDNSSTGLWATIDNPVRAYIASHSTELPIPDTTVYALWQITGTAAFAGAFLTRSNGLRITWIAWGAATIAMVWIATPDPSRTIATGIALLAWTTASTLALRGIHLRPQVFNSVHSAPKIDARPQVHIPAQPDPTPDNIRHLNH